VNPNEVEVRNISEVTIVSHGPDYSAEVWIGNSLVFFTPKVTYHPAAQEPPSNAWRFM
jgi:hypothetical protein